MIGDERKENRLRWLKNYWVDKVKNVPKIKFYSPLENHNSCAIATVGIEGIKPQDIDAHLLNTQNVHVVAIEWKKVFGVRVTPNVYTSTGDLDKLVKGLITLAEK
jgi:selenocysteine lyase/cysteine desulfurase